MGMPDGAVKTEGLDGLLMSLAVVGRSPTGLANYAVNLAHCLPLAGTTFLTPFAMPDLMAAETGNPSPSACIPIPANLSADDGKRGHLNRLTWTQWGLPPIYQQTQTQLLFSPVPEAPLGKGCHSVVMVHDLIPLRFPRWRSPLYSYFRFYVPAVLRQARHILCNSTATATEIMEWYGISAQNITPIPLAYDARNFHVPVAADLAQPKSGDRPYFVHLGRHDPHKNVGILIEAYAEMVGLLGEGDRPDLWLIGPADARYTPALQARAQALGIADRVKYLGYVPYSDLPKILAGAIALLFPSLWEGFGFPVLEAMACGTPVVTSTVSALPEVAGEAALLIDPRNPQALAAAMADLARDATLRAQLTQAGLARATQFSWHKTAQQTAEVLAQYLQL